LNKINDKIDVGDFMSLPKICIIGGGDSGMTAAIVARRNGADLTIIERNSRVGKKILATGNGRCNYTNVLTSVQDYNNPDFVSYALSHFSPAKALDFFGELGVVPKIEKAGKTYPLSEQASSIVDVFLYELEHLGIETVTDAFVYNIIRKNNYFTIQLQDGRNIDCDKVIISTGGMALPKSGSDGSGYELAKHLGHTITEVFPAIVKLKLESPYLNHLEGIKMPTKVELLVDGQVVQEAEDDILFGNYGISGPAILDISRKANELYLAGKDPYVKLILVSQLSRRQVEDRFANSLDRPIDFALVGLIHKRYISALIKEAKIDKQNTLVKDLSHKQLEKVITLLFDWRFKIRGSKSFQDAQATAGGVNVKEINDLTMESLLVNGLYFTGEVMDIDGRCGGFNLQWAWSSGYLAGYHASTGTVYGQDK